MEKTPIQLSGPSCSSYPPASSSKGEGDEICPTISHPDVPELTLLTNFITEQEENMLATQLDAMPWSNEIRRRTQQYGYHYSFRYRGVVFTDEEGNDTPPMPQCFDFLLHRFWQWRHVVPFHTPPRDFVEDKIDVKINNNNNTDNEKGVEDNENAKNGHNNGSTENKKENENQTEIEKEEKKENEEEEWRLWAPDQAIINSYEPGEAIAPHVDSVEDWAGCVASLSLLDDWTMTFSEISSNKEVDVVLPRRSLVVLVGVARYDWRHGLKPQIDGRQRRISLTFRKYRPDRPRKIKKNKNKNASNKNINKDNKINNNKRQHSDKEDKNA